MKSLSPNTIKAYKAAIARPVRLAWGIDITDPFFTELVKAFGNLRPSAPLRPILRSLDKILIHISSDNFCMIGNVENALMKCLFLLALVT